MSTKVDEKEIGEVARMDSLLKAALQTVAGAQFQGSQLDMHNDPSRTVLQGKSYEQLSSDYENDGIFSAIIDRAAEDAMAAGFVFHKDAAPETIDEFTRLELDEVFTDALRFARLHGGSVIVPIFVGNSNLAQPLYRSRKVEIDYFEVISIDRLSVDVEGPDGMPLIYNVNSLLSKDGGSFRLHASRCIYVAGRRRTHRQVDPTLIWPGVSEGLRCREAATRLSRSFKWAEKALERKQQGVFKMKGLAQAMQMKQQDLVTNRLNLVDAVRSILNTIAIDESDDYTVNDTNLSSISDTLDSQMQALAAVSGYPITVLFGRRTTSLNAKGDSDTDTYYRMLNKIRTNMLRNPLQRIVELISAYMDTTVPDGETLVEIGKLEALSEYEEAEIEERKAKSLKTRAEALQIILGGQDKAAPAGPAPKPSTTGNAAPPAPPAAPKPVAKTPLTPLTPDEVRRILLNEE